MCGMSRNITTFMIGMDRQVQSHQFDKLFVFAVSHQMGEIVSVIFIFDDAGKFSALVDVLVDSGGNSRKFGDQGHGIFEGVFPVFLLVDTFGVSLGKGGLMFQCSHGYSVRNRQERNYRARVEPLDEDQWDIGR